MTKWMLILLSIITLNSYADDKLDVQSLEKKYFASKDDDFKVIQNRTYTKEKRYFFNGSLGIPFNDYFNSGNITSLEVGYHFNERYGVSLQYTMGSLVDNDALVEFKSRYQAIPDHNVFKGSTMIQGHYVPLYAKMSFLDTSIIYFDMGISVGLGNTEYTITKQEGGQQKTSFSYQISIFQQIFFTEHFSLKLDFINRWTEENKFKYYYSDPINRSAITGRDLGTKVYNDQSLMLGVTYWL